jgi:very-short-patch-repair endonuclease
MYPIVKIPKLISLTSKVIINNDRGIKLIDVYLPRLAFLDESPKHSRLINITNLVGHTLLLLSAVIFYTAVFVDRSWLDRSCLTFFLGLASINLADLLLSNRTKKEYYESTTDREIEPSRSTQIDPVDWDEVLIGKVMKYGAVAQAQVGVSEAHFERYLKKYFGDYLKPGYEFELNDRFKYSSDFTLILPKSISLIIEVDEPYEGRTKNPHHCKDDGKDDYRDNFFLKGNWIVIRFSEFQVCAFPDEYCYKIAKTIDSIDPRFNFADRFIGIGQLPLDRRWSEREARAMAKRDYRLDYLKRYNVYTQIENTAPKKPSSKVKTSKRK